MAISAVSSETGNVDPFSLKTFTLEFGAKYRSQSITFMTKQYNITVVGLGYVGMSLAVLLARQHRITALDIDEERVARVNSGRPTVADALMTEYMLKEELSLVATTSPSDAYVDADFVIVATPTDYHPEKNYFETSSVEAVVEQARNHNSTATVVIKSTIPVGFTEQLRQKFSDDKLLFSPEFLREGQALHDNLHPSRVIVGGAGDEAVRFGELLRRAALDSEVPVLLMGSAEAEAVKLFANTYLAMRVAFFNELDSFGMARGLNVREIIDGVSLDPRIGLGYNNPSFGYGGYCLPKDTKQLLANYEDIPQHVMQAVVDSNVARKDFLANEILSLKPSIVGIYRLAMKSGSDNTRSAAIQGIMKRLKAEGIEVLVWEPILRQQQYFDSEVVADLNEFLARSDIIVANRLEPNLLSVREKVFTRDLYGEH